MKLLATEPAPKAAHHPYGDRPYPVEKTWVTEVWRNQVQVDHIFSASELSAQQAEDNFSAQYGYKNVSIVTRSSYWQVLRVK